MTLISGLLKTITGNVGEVVQVLALAALGTANTALKAATP